MLLLFKRNDQNIQWEIKMSFIDTLVQQIGAKPAIKLHQSAIVWSGVAQSV
jgi:hypothetical protein